MKNVGSLWRWIRKSTIVRIWARCHSVFIVPRVEVIDFRGSSPRAYYTTVNCYAHCHQLYWVAIVVCPHGHIHNYRNSIGWHILNNSTIFLWCELTGLEAPSHSVQGFVRNRWASKGQGYGWAHNSKTKRKREEKKKKKSHRTAEKAGESRAEGHMSYALCSMYYHKHERYIKRTWTHNVTISLHRYDFKLNGVFPH